MSGIFIAFTIRLLIAKATDDVESEASGKEPEASDGEVAAKAKPERKPAAAKAPKSKVKGERRLVARASQT